MAIDVQGLSDARAVIRTELETLCKMLVEASMTMHAAKAWLYSKSSVFAVRDARTQFHEPVEADGLILIWKEIEALTDDVYAKALDRMPPIYDRLIEQVRAVDAAVEALVVLWCRMLNGTALL